MMNYKVPKYTGAWDRFDETDFMHRIHEAQRQNQKVYAEAAKLHSELVTLAVRLYGRRSRQVKYLRREAPERPPDLMKKSHRPTMRKYTKWLAREAERAKQREYRARRAETNELLEDHGYIPGKHYKPTRAISFAKKVMLYDEDGNPLPIRPLPQPDNKS